MSYRQAVDDYFNFYRSRNNGLSPKFGAIEGKKLKAILKALNQRGEAHDNFRAILIRWDQLSPWLRSNAVDLKVFESKLNVIINELNNASRKEEIF